MIKHYLNITTIFLLLKLPISGNAQSFNQTLFEARQLFQDGQLVGIPSLFKSDSLYTKKQLSKKYELLTYVHIFMGNPKLAEVNYIKLLRLKPLLLLNKSQSYNPPPNGKYFGKDRNNLSYHPELTQLTKNIISKVPLSIDLGPDYTFFFYRALSKQNQPFLSKIGSYIEVVDWTNSNSLGYKINLTTNLFSSKFYASIGFSLWEINYDYMGVYENAPPITTDRIDYADGWYHQVDVQNRLSIDYKEEQQWVNIPLTIKYLLGDRNSKLSLIGGLQYHALQKSVFSNITGSSISTQFVINPGEVLASNIINPGLMQEFQDNLNKETPARIKHNFSIFFGVEGNLGYLTKNISVYGHLLVGRQLISWKNEQEIESMENLFQNTIQFEENDFNFDYLNLSLGLRYTFYKVKKLKK